MTFDRRRTARLVLDPDIRAGRISADRAASPEVLRTTPSFKRPMAAVRYAQRLRAKLGWEDGIRATIGTAQAIRRAAFQESSDAPPRFLVRVDEYPISSSRRDFGLEEGRRVHEVLSSAGVPYLLSVVPSLADSYLDPAASGERELQQADVAFLTTASDEGASLAQHGTTHRTRFARPRRHSELTGLRNQDLRELLHRGREILSEAGIATRILVVPFNRFSFEHWPVLSNDYLVVTGGPEAIPVVGLQPAPICWDGGVYLPSYFPLYAPSAVIRPAVEQVIALAPGTWVPIVIHSAWEFEDGLESLAALSRQLAPFAAPWEEFLDAVERSTSDDSQTR